MFEGSNWIFDDGTNSISVSYTYEDDSPPSIIALGNIGNTDYASFFGFTNPWGTIGELAFILFDIDGTSAVNPFSPNLNVMLTAGSAFDPATPEPDVLGRFAPVPIPGAALALLVLLAQEYEERKSRGKVSLILPLFYIDLWYIGIQKFCNGKKKGQKMLSIKGPDLFNSLPIKN